MNNSVFRKTMENFQKYRDIKLLTRDKNNKLFGVRTKFFTENLLTIEMKKLKCSLINLSN